MRHRSGPFLTRSRGEARHGTGASSRHRCAWHAPGEGSDLSLLSHRTTKGRSATHTRHVKNRGARFESHPAKAKPPLGVGPDQAGHASKWMEEARTRGTWRAGRAKRAARWLDNEYATNKKESCCKKYLGRHLLQYGPRVLCIARHHTTDRMDKGQLARKQTRLLLLQLFLFLCF